MVTLLILCATGRGFCRTTYDHYGVNGEREINHGSLYPSPVFFCWHQPDVHRPWTPPVKMVTQSLMGVKQLSRLRMVQTWTKHKGYFNLVPLAGQEHCTFPIWSIFNDDPGDGAPLPAICIWASSLTVITLQILIVAAVLDDYCFVGSCGVFLSLMRMNFSCCF